MLAGKTILVSGVGPGLGRAIASVAHRDGANVMIAARREESLRESVQLIDPSGDRVAWKVTDITDREHDDAVVAATIDRFGALDGVVHCAAFDSLMGGLEGADLAVWRDVFEVNVFGSIQLTRSALPHLKASRGSIVIISSQTLYHPTVLQTAYGASKGALLGAMHSLAFEFGPAGVRVNQVVPSWMWGPPVEGYVNYLAAQRGVSPDDVLAEITKPMALRKMTEDDDVAEAVAFLLSDRSKAITGQSLFVNSGELMT